MVKLFDNIEQALNWGNSPMASVIYNDNIIIGINDTVLRKFDGFTINGTVNYTLVDSNNEVIKDITTNVYNDGEYYEFVGLGIDLGFVPVILRITDDNGVKYSNMFILTDEDLHTTTFYQYKNIGDEYYQSIRLNTYFLKTNNVSEVQDYFQITSERTISARALKKVEHQYKADYIDRLAYDLLNEVLLSDVIYIDNERVTNKTAVESNELIGFTNLFEVSFSLFKNEAETLDIDYQIYEGLILTSKSPDSIYTLAGKPSDLVLTFNESVIIGQGTLTINGVEYNENDFNTHISGNVVTLLGAIDLITSNGVYEISFTEGLFVSELRGSTISETWTFEIADADFSSADFNDDFFII